MAISINLKTILATEHIPFRALEPLVLLLTALIASVLCLMPHQTASSVGLELLGAGLIAWAMTLRLDFGIARTAASKRNPPRFWFNAAFSQAALLPYLIGAATMLLGKGGGLD